ncbi:hypothetical protein E5P44_21030 [Escherichia coli]|nr:hypothetical protein MC57_001335 [Enterobacter hormaechei]TGI22022.1 hypothetical protein E5P50_23365 [Escherichia coli]QFI35530.1 hypothetical protein F1597_26155 [Enterobacter hormaechei]TGI31386.1 hypothetical protein E5P48_22675 [Escherichia coli]TGI33574.1 hypothetical protein E5P47_21510 [Escherichia coli]
MGSCAAPSAKGDDKFITTDYLQQCLKYHCSCPVEIAVRKLPLPVINPLNTAGKIKTNKFISFHRSVSGVNHLPFVLCITRFF